MGAIPATNSSKNIKARKSPPADGEPGRPEERGDNAVPSGAGIAQMGDIGALGISFDIRTEE